MLMKAARKTLRDVRLALANCGWHYEAEIKGENGTILTLSCPACELAGQTNELTITIDGYHTTYNCPLGHGGLEMMTALKPRHGKAPLIPTEAFPVVWDTSTKTPKLILPEPPEPDDVPALCAWLTSVLRLDALHGVSGVARYGRQGQDGHVIIARHGLPARYHLRFEPAGIISSARRFTPALEWQLSQADDLRPWSFKDEHCRVIAHVVRLLADEERSLNSEQETAGIVAAFTFKADLIEGCTVHGTSAQRFEAVMSLRPPDRFSTPRYLLDSSTGELVIRTGDLQAAAREQLGSSVPHGWLDARMQELGWERGTLQGYEQRGREGRRGAHLRCDVYRGHMPDEPSANGSVNT